jgi:hypothetical protein
MRVCIILAILFAMLIGACHAENVDIGNVTAFKQTLEKVDSLYNKAG